MHTYRIPGLLHTTDNHVRYCLSKELTPDLRQCYFKPQLLGAFPWKCLGRAYQTSLAAPCLLNGAKTQSIWTHENKIPFTVILETISKGKKKQTTQQNSILINFGCSCDSARGTLSDGLSLGQHLGAMYGVGHSPPQSEK